MNIADWVCPIRSEALDEILRELSDVVACDPIVTACFAAARNGMTERQMFRGTSDQHPGCCPVDEPLPTVTAGGTHVAEVRAFLTAYYSRDAGQALDEPARTFTAKHRLGLVTVEGTDYQITDIGLRMLQPHELLRAQFGRFADGYLLDAARTKAAKVRLIGNSVCPEVAEAVVRANLADVAERGAA